MWRCTALIEQLIEKWTDVLECSDSFTERTLCEEFLEDLKELRKIIND